MYKRTDPQQTLFGVETQLAASLRTRLKDSWAQLFRLEILPILLKSEDQFAMLYGKTGRPNFSVARMLGLCFLQELNSMSDQQALDTFGFDTRWRYALDVRDEDAYLSRRSLVEFRRRLAAQDPDMMLVRVIFEGISKSAIKKLGLSTSEQRVDSTHIVSNICTRGRLDLFQKTIDHFIKSLDKKCFSRIPKNIQKWHQREPEGWFGVGQTQRAVKLEPLAKYLNKLIAVFKNDPQVTATEPYQLLVRLFKEQCEVINKSGPNQGDDTHKKIKVKKKSQGTTLQSPYDPDASYGHKGKGYSAHITETCNNQGKCEIITDFEVHGAARSDKGKATQIVNRLASADLKPETLYADGGYPSAPSALEVVTKDIEFIAPVDRARLAEDVMGRDRFEFDQDGLVVQCPQKHRPIDHRMRSSNNKKGSSLHAIFDGDTCRACSKINQCPVRAPNNRKRGCNPRDTKGNFRIDIAPKLRLRDQMYADQQTDVWKQRYKIRSGIEATMSELKRSHALGKLRVRRSAKVCFAVACKVIACNIKRWALAYEQSHNALLRIFCSIYDGRRLVVTIFKEQYPILQTDRFWVLQIVG
jgi:Transposase DDE domain/Transposase domain (DUF772)